MPFAQIQHCIICEDVRIERKGLGSILGFYGIAPEVEILVGDFNKPIQRLCFFLVAKGGTPGKYKLDARVCDESGTEVITFNDIMRDDQDRKERQYFALGVIGPKFPHPGLYTFKLNADGAPHFGTTFSLKQGTPADFT